MRKSIVLRTTQHVLPALAVLLWATTASAQLVPDLSASSQQDALSQLRKQVAEAQVTNLISEGVIDQDEYRVGPGDVFLIAVGGAIENVQSAQVGADGRLIIPATGGIDIGGLTLAAARETVLNVLGEAYAHVAIDITLERPRLFYVHVTGAVPLPGKYVASAMSRVDDAVQLAYANRSFDLQLMRTGRGNIDADAINSATPHPTSERPAMSGDFAPSLRSIRITHTDGSETTVDLLRYYATGDRDNNPYVRDGDVINIPPFQEATDAIRISGPVPFAGTYPFRNGDRLSDILVIANGSDDLSSIGSIRVTTKGADGPVVRSLEWQSVRLGSEEDVALRPGDFVRIDSPEQASAGVFGWVRYPATYPIVGGETTVTEALALAGGLRAEADLRLAYIERRGATLLKPEAGTSDLDFFSRVFFARAKSAQRLHVDVAAIIRGDAEDVVLENGDSIIFPRLEETVYVIGNVVQGGYVPFVEGRNASYYIDRAGGQAPNSTGVFVYDSISGRVLSGANAPVTAGATVYVDREGVAETPELQSLLVTQETSRRQLRLASTQTVISGITAITAIITTVVAITR